MIEVTGKSKLRCGNTKVDIVYEVFRNTNKYMSPEIAYRCSKTAAEVAYYIIKDIIPNQTSIVLTAKNIINSNICKCKSPNAIRAAIRELVDIGAIVRWRDIDDFPENIIMNDNIYLLNPLMLKCISCDNFRRQVKDTLNRINNSSICYIDEFSAIVYDFKDHKDYICINNKEEDKNNDTEPSQFAACVKYYD